MAESKKFKATWGEGYAAPGEQIVGESFFTELVGYDTIDIKAIKELEIGEIMDLSGPMAQHNVRRIE